MNFCVRTVHRAARALGGALPSLLVLAVIQSQPAQAQSGSPVRGVVTDANTKAPIGGVTVTIPGTRYAALTND